MPGRRCKCPGSEVFERGGTRAEVWTATEAAAIAALPGLIRDAQGDALTAQKTALDAALKVGDKACVGTKCEAWFKSAPLDGPWTAVGSVAPYTRWLARAGFSWEVLVKCELKE